MAATLEELERRVLALEKRQHELQRAQNESTVPLKRLAGTLAQVKALADDHTERLQRIEHDVKGLRADMPSIVADALRDTRRTD